MNIAVYGSDKDNSSDWLPIGDKLEVSKLMSGQVSPRLGVRFELSVNELQLDPPDGEPFATYLELAALKEQAQKQLEQERQAKEEAQQQLEQE